MLDHAGPDPRPDVWVGIIAALPWILLYLRGFITELGKFSAQALWKLVARSTRTKHRNDTVTVLVVLTTEAVLNDAVVDEGRPSCRQFDLLS